MIVKVAERGRPRPKVAFLRAKRDRRFEELWNRKSQLYLALCVHVLIAEFIPNKEATIIAESIL